MLPAHGAPRPRKWQRSAPVVNAAAAAKVAPDLSVLARNSVRLATEVQYTAAVVAPSAWLAPRPQ